MPSTAVNRRGFLKASLGGSAALVAAPTLVSWLAAADAKAATAAPASTAPLAFVDDYKTNVMANLTPETNAVVRVLGGMAQVWKTGAAWNTGTALRPDVLRANMRYCARVTTARTEAQAREAFVHDRQHQSYAMIGALGPLAYSTAPEPRRSPRSPPPPTPLPRPRSATPSLPTPRPVPRSAPGRTPRTSGWSPSWSTPCAARSRPATPASTRSSTRGRGA